MTALAVAVLERFKIGWATSTAEPLELEPHEHEQAHEQAHGHGHAHAHGGGERHAASEAEAEAEEAEEEEEERPTRTIVDHANKWLHHQRYTYAPPKAAAEAAAAGGWRAALQGLVMTLMDPDMQARVQTPPPGTHSLK